MNEHKSEILKDEFKQNTSVDSKKLNMSISKPEVKVSYKGKLLQKLGYQRTGAFLGLDIGNFFVKMVELKKVKDKFILLNAGMEKIPNPSEEEDLLSKISSEQDSTSIIIKSLRQLLKNQSFKIDKVVSSLPGDLAVERFIKVPSLKKKELDEVLQWEAQKYLNHPLEEIVFDYSIIGEDKKDNNLEILLIISLKKEIKKHLNLLQASGLKPIALETRSQALHNALLNSISFKDEVVALVDIGAEFSILNIAQAGLLRFSRGIKIGGQHLTQALANDLDWNIKKAESFKQRLGFLSVDEFKSLKEEELGGKVNLIREEILTDYLEKLATEIERSFEYYLTESGNEKIDLLFITGGSSKLKNLDRSLEEKLRVKTEIFNPFKYVLEDEELTQDWEDLGPHLTVAFGSATWSQR